MDADGDCEADGDKDRDSELEGLKDADADELGDKEALGLVLAEGERDALGERDADAEEDGLTDAEGLRDALALEDGLKLADGDKLAEGESDRDAEELGDRLADGESERLAELEGDREADGEREADGDCDADAEPDGDKLAEGDNDREAEDEGLWLAEGEMDALGDCDADGEIEALPFDEYCQEANTPTDSVDEPKSIVMARPVSGEANSVCAPVAVTNVSSVASKSSVRPVHAAVELAAVIPAPIANPTGTSRLTVGSPAVLLSESYAVTLESPVARHAPMAQRRTPVLKVTTMSPVVPVGTFAIARPAVSPFVAVFVCWTVMVAETPPIVTLLIVAAVPALRATAETMMYLPLSAVPKS